METRRRLLLLNGARSYGQIVKQICGSSLIGYWPLDERSGSVAYDRSGNGRNGAHTGVTLLNPGAELLTNGGFETAGAGGADVFGTWGESAGDGAITDEGVIVLTGSHAAKLTAGATVNTYLGQGRTTIPWAQYALRFYSRGDGTNAGRYSVYDSTNSANILGITSTGIASAAYAPVAYAFQNPGGCVSTTPYLRCPAAAGGIAYFDDVSLVATAPNGIRGATAPFYDGVNDFTNIYSAGLASAFNGAEGSLVVWARVSGAGVWTDAAQRNLVTLQVDAGNYVAMYKITTANTLRLAYRSGAVTKSQDYTGASTGWVCYGVTWSASGNAVRMFANGAQIGTDLAAGTWAGVPAETTTLLGASTLVPGSVWLGLLGHALICNRALSAAEIARLYTAGLPLVA